jgi:hypothetical protein
VIEIYVHYFSATKSPMKNLKLLAAITAACSALISGLQAAPITYSFVNNAAFQNGYTLSGSITTDGTTGALSNSNITGWNFVITNTATSVVEHTQSGTGVYTLRFNASATQLTLPPASDSLGSSSFQLNVGGGMFSWQRIEAMEMRGPFGLMQFPAMESYFVSLNTQFWSNDQQPLALTSTAGGDWIIAEVSTVPEPSTYSLLFGGFTLAVVAMRRRASKQA